MPGSISTFSQTPTSKPSSSHGSSLSLIPAGPGGVRDYAELIAGHLDAPVTELTSTTDTSGWSGDLLLLHFSGYGFQKRGVGTWLPKEMGELRKRFKVFGVVFHELYAFGPPWKSQFWLCGLQKKIARDLLLQADFWHTPREIAAQWLVKCSAPKPPAPHRVVPVFSNVGEPASIDTQREPVLVVFGTSQVRVKAYAWNNGEIYDFARRQGLRIHDIGSPLPDSPISRRMAQEGVVMHGQLAADRVSAALLSARFGVVEYSPKFAAKSGILAAYAVHGTCPILLWRDYGVHDGLVPGVNHVAGFKGLGTGDVAAQAVQIGRAARAWYEPHGVDAHIAALKTLRTEARP
jgi:hypothetical protein